MTLDPRFADPAALAAEQQQQAAQAQAYLDQLRAANNANRPRTVGQVAGDLGAQLLQGAVGLGQAAYGAGNLATLGYLDRATGMSGNFKQTNDIINSWKSAQTQAALARSSAAFDRGIGAGMYNAVTDPLLLLDLLGQNALSVVPAAAGAQFAARGLTAAEVAPAAIAKAAAQGAARAGGVQAAGASNVDIVNAAREAGMDDGSGQLAGLVGGVATGAMTPAVSRITGAAELEGQLAAKLLGQTAAASATKAGLVRAGLTGLAKEGAEETIQSGAEQLIQNLSVGKPAMEGVAEKAALGGIAGGLMGFGFGAYAGPRNNTQQRQEINAQLQQSAADAGVPATGGALSSGPAGTQGALFPDVGGPAIQSSGLSPEESQAAAHAAAVERTVARADELKAQIARVDGLLNHEGLSPEVHYALRDELAQAQSEYDKLRLPAAALTSSVANTQARLGFGAGNGGIEVTHLDPAEEITIGTPEDYDPLSGVGERLDLLGDPEFYTNFARSQASASGDTGIAKQLTTGGQQGLFGTEYLTQLRNAAKAQDALASTDAQLRATQAEAVPVKDLIEQQAQGTGLGQEDLLTAAELRDQARSKLESEVRSRLFTEHEDGSLSRYNPDYQANEPVTKGEATKRTKEIARAYAEELKKNPDGVDLDQFIADFGKTGEQLAAEQQQKENNNAVQGTEAKAAEEVAGETTKLVDLGKFADDVAKAKPGYKRAAINDAMSEQTDPDALDEMYTHLKQMPEYKAMTPAERADVHRDYVAAYSGITGAKYSVTGSGKPAHEVLTEGHIANVNAAVASANATRTGQEGEVKAFNTVNDFEAATGVKAPPDAKGVFLPDGTVAVIAENVKDAEDAVKTIVHERTHEGMRGLLGDSLETVTNRLWANAGMRNRLREKMKLGLDRATAAEEVLTDMAENGEKLTGDVRSKIKSGIAKAFDALLGSSEYNVTDADVDALLKDVANYRATGASEPTSRMGQAEAFAELDKLLVSPADDRVTGIRFSRAIDDLRKLATEDTPNVTAANAIGGAAKDVTSYVAGLLSAVRGGKFGSVPRFLYRFVGPTQLHASFGKLWHDAETGANSYDSFNRNYQAWADDRQTMVHAYGEDVERAYSAMAKASPAKTKVWNALVQYSTFFQLFPGRDVQPEGNAYANDAERAEAKTYLDALWKKLGPDEQALYNKVQENYKKLFSDRYNAIKATLLAAKGIESLETATPEQRASFMDEFGDLIESLMKSNGNAPYSPLRRYGNFMVSVVDDKGKQVWFSGHDTEAEAVKFAADQRARFGDGFKVSTMQKAEFNLSLDGVNTELINKLRNGIAAAYPVVDVDPNATAQQQAEQAARNKHNAEMQAAVGDALVDAYLHSIPQNSLMNSAHARKFIEGFPLDAHRAYNGYVLSAASNIANIRYSGALTKDLSDMASHIRKVGEGNDSGVQMMNVLNAVRGQYEGSRSSEVNPFAQAINTASFLWMLTSPSQMFMNGMQTPMVAAPRMAARFGTATATSKLMAAAKQYFTKEGILGDPTVHPAVAGVLNTLHQTGMDDFTLASTMADIAQGGDSDANSAWRKITRTAAWAMHKSEVFNRQVTAHAFASMALEGIQADPKFDTPEKVQAELLRQTRDFIDNQSHFNYDPHNAPEMMQGPWKKVIMQFQRYRLNMLAMLARDLRGAELGKLLSIQPALNPEDAKLARKTLLYTIGTQAAMTGAVGTVLSPAVFFIMDAFKDDDDLLDSRTEFIQSYGQIMSHGLLGGLPLLNLDPSRIESGSVLPFIGDRQYAPKDKPAADVARYYMEKLLGPAAGLGRKMWEGTAALTEGDIAGAYKMLPAPLADVAKTASELDGVRDKRGVKYYDPTILDSLKGVLGLRSADRLEAEEKRGAVYQAEAHVKELSKRALAKAAVGFATGDAELQQEGTDRFMELAGKHPELVKGSELRRAIAGVAKAQYNADRYGIPQSSRLSDEVLSAVGE